MSRDIDWTDKDLLPAIAEVRDFDKPTDWCLFYYKERGKRTCAVTVKAKGEGGLDEMIKFLRDDEILFGLLSLPVNDTQKLALLIWIGDGTPFSLRAGIIYHQASIAQFFQPYALQLQASRAEELEWNIYGRLEGSARVASHSLRRKNFTEKRASRTLYAKSARGFWSGQDEENPLSKRRKRVRKGSDQTDNGMIQSMEGDRFFSADTQLVRAVERGAMTERDRVRNGNDLAYGEDREKAKALFLAMGLDEVHIPADRRELIDGERRTLAGLLPLHSSMPTIPMASRPDLAQRSLISSSSSSSSSSTPPSSPHSSALPLPGSSAVTATTAVGETAQNGVEQSTHHVKSPRDSSNDKRRGEGGAQEQTPAPPLTPATPALASPATTREKGKKDKSKDKELEKRKEKKEREREKEEKEKREKEEKRKAAKEDTSARPDRTPIGASTRETQAQAFSKLIMTAPPATSDRDQSQVNRGSETELADRSQSRKKSSSFAPDEYLTTTSPFSSPKASRRKFISVRSPRARSQSEPKDLKKVMSPIPKLLMSKMKRSDASSPKKERRRDNDDEEKESEERRKRRKEKEKEREKTRNGGVKDKKAKHRDEEEKDEKKEKRGHKKSTHKEEKKDRHNQHHHGDEEDKDERRRRRAKADLSLMRRHTDDFERGQHTIVRERVKERAATIDLRDVRRDRTGSTSSSATNGRKNDEGGHHHRSRAPSSATAPNSTPGSPSVDRHASSGSTQASEEKAKKSKRRDSALSSDSGAASKVKKRHRGDVDGHSDSKESLKETKTKKKKKGEKKLKKKGEKSSSRKSSHSSDNHSLTMELVMSTGDTSLESLTPLHDKEKSKSETFVVRLSDSSPSGSERKKKKKKSRPIRTSKTGDTRSRRSSRATIDEVSLETLQVSELSLLQLGTSLSSLAASQEPVTPPRASADPTSVSSRTPVMAMAIPTSITAVQFVESTPIAAASTSAEENTSAAAALPGILATDVAEQQAVQAMPELEKMELPHPDVLAASSGIEALRPLSPHERKLSLPVSTGRTTERMQLITMPNSARGTSAEGRERRVGILATPVVIPGSQRGSPKPTTEATTSPLSASRRRNDCIRASDEQASKQEQTRAAFAAMANDDNAVLLSILRKGEEGDQEHKEKEKSGGAMGLLRRNSKRKPKLEKEAVAKDPGRGSLRDKEKDKLQDDQNGKNPGRLRKIFQATPPATPPPPSASANLESEPRKEVPLSKINSDSIIVQANQHLHREQHASLSPHRLNPVPLFISPLSTSMQLNLRPRKRKVTQSQARLTDRKMSVPIHPRPVDAPVVDDMRRILSDSSFFAARENDMRTFAELKFHKMQKIETAKASLLLLPQDCRANASLWNNAITSSTTTSQSPGTRSSTPSSDTTRANRVAARSPSPDFSKAKLSLDMIKSLQRIVFDSSDDEREQSQNEGSTSRGSESETERHNRRIRRKKRRKNDSVSYSVVQGPIRTRKRSATLPDISSQSLVETVSSVIIRDGEEDQWRRHNGESSSPRSQLIIDLAKNKQSRKRRKKRSRGHKERSKREVKSRENSRREKLSAIGGGVAGEDEEFSRMLISADELKARVIKMEEARLAGQGKRMSFSMVKALEVPQAEKVERAIRYSVGLVPAPMPSKSLSRSESFSSTSQSGTDNVSNPGSGNNTFSRTRGRAYTSVDVPIPSSHSDGSIDAELKKLSLTTRAVSDTSLDDKRILTPRAKRLASPRAKASVISTSTRSILRKLSRAGRSDSHASMGNERRSSVESAGATRSRRNSETAATESWDEDDQVDEDELGNGGGRAMDLLEFLRSTTPMLAKNEQRMLAKQQDKERRKQEKKRRDEERKLDKLISARQKTKKYSFLPFSLKKVDSQPHFSDGDKRIGALWDPREQVKQRRKEGKAFKVRETLERKAERNQLRTSASDLRVRESSDKLMMSSDHVYEMWDRGDDAMEDSMSGSSKMENDGSDGSNSGKFIPRLNFKPRPRSYTYAQENSRVMGPLPSPLTNLRRIGSTPHTGEDDAPHHQQSKTSTSTSNSQSTSPRVSDLESPGNYGRRMGRNISLGEESEETGGEDVDELSTRSSLIASPATRSTPRSQHKQRVFEELRRERERLARVLMAELERMEHEQKEERPTRRQLRQAESSEGAVLNFDELEFEGPEEAAGLKGEKDYRSLFKGRYHGMPVRIEHIAVPTTEPARALFTRELGTMRELRSPHIALVLGAALKDEREGFLVTEYLNDVTLLELLENDSKKLSWGLRLKMAKDIAQGLVHMHSKKVVHRDIRSQNLRVSSNFRIKLSDFGFARKLAMEPILRMSIRGTEVWRAPEVIMGENSDQRADIFSLGVVFWELMARRDGRDFHRVVDEGFSLDFQQILKNFIAEDAPPGWIRLARDCCSIDPTARPLGRQLLARLDEIASPDSAEDNLSMLLNHLQTFDRTCLRSTKTADRSAPLLINAVAVDRVLEEIQSFSQENLRAVERGDQHPVRSSLTRDVYNHTVIANLAEQIERLLLDKAALAEENKQLAAHNQKMKTQIERFVTLLK